MFNDVILFLANPKICVSVHIILYLALFNLWKCLESIGVIHCFAECHQCFPDAQVFPALSHFRLVTIMCYCVNNGKENAASPLRCNFPVDSGKLATQI